MSSATHNSQFCSQNRDKCYNVNAVAGGGTDVQRRGQREGGSKRHERVRCMPTANFGSVLVDEGVAAACFAHPLGVRTVLT